MSDELEHSDSFLDDGEPRSSKLVWEAICQAEKYFEPYWNECDRIDGYGFSASQIQATRFWSSDKEFDLFWASMEILKPAIYARPPKPVVSPRFADRNKVATVASELLERCLVSSFERGDFDQVMLGVRDDLAFAARGVARITYESDKGKRVCDEHVDRRDFLHEPARKWAEVGWVAFRAYLTEREMRKRFPDRDLSGVQYGGTSDNRRESDSVIKKAAVWEVWHKADNRVYWVTEGVDTLLDESVPFLDLDGFFPCPRPAYGTLRRRTLVPVPDYCRYERHLDQINDLTRRIYDLLDWVRVKGLIPAGGDVGEAIEAAFAQSSDAALLIPIPSAALMQGSGQFVQFLPIQEFAAAITGLIEARGQLIQDFYQLSGISDIMRGATEAEETLGAQRLKSQYGSIRVRDKIDELQRLARDVARISGEIIAEKFDQKTLLEMAQMDIPTKKDVEKQLKQLEGQAKKELDALAQQAEQALAQQPPQQQGQPDTQQAEQQFAQQQQAIIAKYQPQIEAITNTVTIDDVMELIRDQKTRAFVIEIETDSTILVDEQAEKESRGEFLTAFATTAQAIQPLLAAGESGAALAGGLLKFALAPFRAGRELDGLVDDFVEKAPQALAQQQGGEEQKALVEAQNKLAEAEMAKAQAQAAKVQADAQGKMHDLQLRVAEAQEKSRSDQQRFALEVEKLQAQVQETGARTEKIFAEIEAMGFKARLDARAADREDIKVVSDVQARETDQRMAAQQHEQDAALRGRDSDRADRQQDFTERSNERQQSFAERQAMNGGANG